MEVRRHQEVGGPEGSSACPHCGAAEVGGAEGCNEIFQEVVGREFTRPELFQVHRLTVDAYSLQHPDQYMKSAKSAVAHLTGMCWAMEEGENPSVSTALSRFLDGTPSFTRPEPIPPAEDRGPMTIVDIFLAPDSAEHIRRVREWARGAWEAWSDHHAQARIWMEEAKREGRSSEGVG